MQEELQFGATVEDPFAGTKTSRISVPEKQTFLLPLDVSQMLLRQELDNLKSRRATLKQRGREAAKEHKALQKKRARMLKAGGVSFLQASHACRTGGQRLIC